jgi:uncharacterized protein (TIGR00375 family)
MKFIADLHIHSKFSRATSRDMDLEHICEWAKFKGIELLGTGDFTHPGWLKELRFKLEPKGGGIYHYRGVNFIFSAEVCSIFTKDDRVRKVHTLLYAPSLEAAEEINARLKVHADLASDGRPIVPVFASRLAEMVLEASPEAMIIPAHIWTPHFALFGANSGFDSVEDCFEEQTPNIFALETGLSSDPAMNWRLSALDKYSLISCSDAHSPSRLGREACVFDCQMDYATIRRVLKEKDKSRFLQTLEYFPQEGKYHYDGHRACNLRLSPSETKKHKGLCPVCGKKITVGVLHRVEDLSDRPRDYLPENPIPFKSLVPLEEILSLALKVGTGTQKVNQEYHKLISHFGNEFNVLLEAPAGELTRVTSLSVAEAVLKMRAGQIQILPGYDGEYGTISFDEGKTEKKEEEKPAKGKGKKQMEMF